MEFIDVKKIIEVSEKDEKGNKILNPHKDGKFLAKGYKTEIETIRTSEIKSSRKWDKNSHQGRFIEGEMTVIYLKGDSSRSTTAQILINESHSSFSQRLKSTPVD